MAYSEWNVNLTTIVSGFVKSASTDLNSKLSLPATQWHWLVLILTATLLMLCAGLRNALVGGVHCLAERYRRRLDLLRGKRYRESGI